VENHCGGVVLSSLDIIYIFCVEVKNMLNPRLSEGSEEWADNITENARQHLLTHHDVLAAHLFIKKLVDDWDTLDDVLRAALFQSAVTVYARPFIHSRSIRHFTFSISGLKNDPGFDKALHDHICELRLTLIAHHDTSMVKAQISHMTVTLTNQQEEGKQTVTIQTEGKVKALHAIAKKESAEQYLRHMAASVGYLYNATQDALGRLHRVRLMYPDLGIAKMKSLSLELERLGNDKFRLPSANPKPIDEPTFIMPDDSYIWLEYTQTFYLVGPVHSASGEQIVEVFDVEKEPGRPTRPTYSNPRSK
jgi:hypothetical protein